jgi:dihydropteroate synthase
MTKLIGILNITPDSFSDGGKFNSLKSALTHLEKLIKDGADMIDIGAESTRPGSVPLTAAAEWSRLENILPAVMAEVKKHPNVQASIDSYHFENIKKSYELGIDIINDVSGLTDEKTIKFIAENGVTTVLMHNLKIPLDPEIIINQSLNINDEIINWAQQKISYLEKMGVKKSQLIFDPGIGFAKDQKQSIAILKYINSYEALNLPIYVGHSKKRFLDLLDIEGDRTTKTLEVSKFLIAEGVDFLRVHDVKSHSDLLKD